MKRCLMLLACIVLAMPTVGCTDPPLPDSAVPRPDADPTEFAPKSTPSVEAPPG